MPKPKKMATADQPKEAGVGKLERTPDEYITRAMCAILCGHEDARDQIDAARVLMDLGHLGRS